MQDFKQEKSPIKQKILLYLASKGVSAYEFYKKSGVTRGVLQQPTGISEDNLAKFLAYAPDLNPAWLMTGEGEMLRGGGHSIVQGDGSGASIGGGDVTINPPADLTAEVAVLRERNRLLQEIINAKDQLIEELKKNK